MQKRGETSREEPPVGQVTCLGAWRPGWLRNGERSRQMQPPEESEILNTVGRGKAAV